MSASQLHHMPLASCYLCENADAEGRRCDTIGNCAERCPACAGTSLLSLAGLLNREPPVGTIDLSRIAKAIWEIEQALGCQAGDAQCH